MWIINKFIKGHPVYVSFFKQKWKNSFLDLVPALMKSLNIVSNESLGFLKKIKESS